MRACERLHLTPQTVSGQISWLEDSFSSALFSKAGRNLELTETRRRHLATATGGS
jgi:LysR family transcriptional activator of nhaA